MKHGTTILTVIVGVAIGLGIYVFTSGMSFSLQSIIESVQGLWTRIQEGVSPLVSAWSNLPGTVQAVIVGAVPTLFMLFFAWTKNRAMQQLQNTQKQASEQITQISGEAYTAQQALGTVTQQRDTLQQKYDSLLNSTSNISDLPQKLAALQTKNDTLTQINQEQGHLLEVIHPTSEQGHLDALTKEHNWIIVSEYPLKLVKKVT